MMCIRGYHSIGLAFAAILFGVLVVGRGTSASAEVARAGCLTCLGRLSGDLPRGAYTGGFRRGATPLHQSLRPEMLVDATLWDGWSAIENWALVKLLESPIKQILRHVR